MKKSILAAWILVAATAGALRAQTPWIIGGAEAAEKQFPWVTNIIYKSRHYCGASLIHPRWVITAGHCLTDNTTFGPIDTASGYIRINSVSSSGALNPDGGVERRIKKVYPHPNFEIFQFLAGYDIGLIELDEPVTSIVPIALPALSDTATLYATGTPVHIAGWGLKDTFSNSASDLLKYCNSKVYDFTVCNARANTELGGPLSPDRFCAGYSGGEEQTGAASGDSGGPIWTEGGTGKVILGVVSGGFGQTTLQDKPGFFTKVAAYRKWIDSVMSAGNTNGLQEVRWADEAIRVGTAPGELRLYFRELYTDKVQVALYSAAGQKIYETDVTHPSFKTFTIDNSAMAQGMYVLKVSGYEKGLYYTRKLVNTGR